MQTRELDALTGLPPIPAMTSQAERECYYRLAKEAKASIIEFGTWLGAATAYMAVAAKERGTVVHTYDKFETKKSHAKLVRQFRIDHGRDPEIKEPDAYNHFLANVGPLAEHMIIHKGRIESAKWDNEPIGLIVFDAPKRIPAMSAVLTNFLPGIRKGTMTAWQDFCHFPSYETPACLYRLREHLQFTEAVVPGATMVFRVKSLWRPSEVSRSALDLKTWTPAEVAASYDYWMRFVPLPKQLLFRCGQAMFLCDIGHPQAGVEVLLDVLSQGDETVAKKWAYLKKTRPDFFIRYRPLFDAYASKSC